MKYIIAALMFFVLGFSAQAQTNRTVMADTNGVVQRPTNFFTTNRILRFDTNFNVVYTNTNTLTFTNVLGFGTNSVAATRTNLGLGASWLTNTDVTNFRTAVGALATNGSAAGLTNFPANVLLTNAATTTVTTFASPNISNNVTLTNVSTNTLTANITYKIYIYSSAYSDGTNGWKIRHNVDSVPNTKIVLAPTKALNGSTYGMGGALTDFNSTISLATSAGDFYIYINTYIVRHTSNVTLNVQFAQNASGADYSTISGTILITPIAW